MAAAALDTNQNLDQTSYNWPQINIKDRRQWTLEKLAISENHKILEIGFGSGVTMKSIANKLASGFVAGIDYSDVLFRVVSKNNTNLIQNNKMKLHKGTVLDLDYPSEFFDIVFSNKVYYFWDDPVHELFRIKDLLKPSGKFMLVFQPLWLREDELIKLLMCQIEQQFVRAGFHSLESEKKSMKPVDCIYIAGHK